MPLPELTPHPEGGRYREVYRSTAAVTRDGAVTRSALTHIYFQLAEGEVSRFHKVASDEVWNLYQGEGIRLLLWDGRADSVEVVELAAKSENFCYVVPAGWWQAAEALGAEVTVGCTVAPGFEFADFELIEEDSTEAEALLAVDSDLLRFIRKA